MQLMIAKDTKLSKDLRGQLAQFEKRFLDLELKYPAWTLSKGETVADSTLELGEENKVLRDDGLETGLES